MKKSASKNQFQGISLDSLWFWSNNWTKWWSWCRIILSYSRKWPGLTQLTMKFKKGSSSWNKSLRTRGFRWKNRKIMRKSMPRNRTNYFWESSNLTMKRKSLLKNWTSPNRSWGSLWRSPRSDKANKANVNLVMWKSFKNIKKEIRIWFLRSWPLTKEIISLWSSETSICAESRPPLPIGMKGFPMINLFQF